MLDLEAAREAISRDLGEFVDRVESLDEAAWERPTPCEGWTVTDLARHVATVAHVDEDLFGKRGSGNPAVPPETEPGDRAAIAASMRGGSKLLADELARITPADLDALCTYTADVGLTLPLSAALQVSVMEFGLHLRDLKEAMGEPSSIRPDVLRSMVSLAPAMLPFLAAGASEQPTEPLAYALRGQAIDVEVAYRDGSWQSGAADDIPTCVIEGDDEAIALFGVGRIKADHPSLSLSGATDAASRFKTYFPGP